MISEIKSELRPPHEYRYLIPLELHIHSLDYFFFHEPTL